LFFSVLDLRVESSYSGLALALSEALPMIIHERTPAFAEGFEAVAMPCMGELFRAASTMLGSRTEAEDVVQLQRNPENPVDTAGYCNVALEPRYKPP